MTNSELAEHVAFARLQFPGLFFFPLFSAFSYFLNKAVQLLVQSNKIANAFLGSTKRNIPLPFPSKYFTRYCNSIPKGNSRSTYFNKGKVKRTGPERVIEPAIYPAY